jgi:outer membrane receptor for ferric coprogen and ferric-rhodotorulic acid
MRKIILTLAAASVLSSLGDAGVAGERRRAATRTGRDVGYFSNDLTGTGGTKIPLRDYPGSATVITRQMMDDIQARSLCDALRLAPGVTVGNCW